jgi:membrane protease YdiL (CAAX protease family)
LVFNALIAQLSEWLGAIAVAWLFSLSPRLKQPPIGFKYARRDGITALMLFGLILILAFGLYTINPPAFPQVVRPAPAPVANLSQALIAALMALAAFVVALVVRKQPARSAGWNFRVGKTDVFFPALQMGIAIAILTIFLRNRVMDVLAGLSPADLHILVLAMGVSLAEETIFRGYIQLRLSWWMGQWVGLALTAALFTLWHLPAWLNRVPVGMGLLLAGLTFVQGLVLGWIMSKSQNVIAPALYRSISIWMNFFG